MNTQSGKVVASFKAHPDDAQQEEENAEEDMDSIETVRFSIDYPWLAAGTTSGHLVIYDYEKGVKRHTCDHDGMAVIDCAWKTGSKSALYIMSACSDGAIRIWDARNGEPQQLYGGGGDQVFALCPIARNDELRLATACSGGAIRIFPFPAL